MPTPSRVPANGNHNGQVVSQGAIVENKRLGAVLSLIQVGQGDRR
jgi:hypothetical protein